jgi:UDP-N-acetylmuramate dehydrogenase
MPLQIEQDVDLTPSNTLAIPSRVDYCAIISSADQLTEAVAFASSHHLPVFTLGKGSNIVLGQEHLHCLALKIEIHGRHTLDETATHTTIAVGAGESWDAFVQWSVAKSLRGIESLSIVPGTVGAAPVQNVGAYGQEVSETITEVAVFDAHSGEHRRLSNEDCHFSYRDSIFKHAGKGRYIITEVTFRLVPQTEAPPPTYASLQAELDRRDITKPTVSDIREAVIAVRTAKLPDPAVTPTAGSFFHNPIVDSEVLQRLQQDHPDIPHWPGAEGRIKLSAPWLVEQVGLKGVVKDGVGLYSKQAICLINPGHQPASVVLAFRDHIIATVQERFGVTLQMEPELIQF